MIMVYQWYAKYTIGIPLVYYWYTNGILMVYQWYVKDQIWIIDVGAEYRNSPAVRFPVLPIQLLEVGALVFTENCTQKGSIGGRG